MTIEFPENEKTLLDAFYHWCFGDTPLGDSRNQGHIAWEKLHPDLKSIGPMNIGQGILYMCECYEKQTGIRIGPSVFEWYLSSGGFGGSDEEG